MSVADLIQLAASLAAVFAVAWGVRLLGLGEEPRIADADHAIRLAEEAHVGFGGVEAAVDFAGYGALVRNAAGQQMVIRPHGNHFAARIIDRHSIARLDKDFLTLSPPDRWFAPITLQLGKDAGRWAAMMRHMDGTSANDRSAANGSQTGSSGHAMHSERRAHG